MAPVPFGRYVLKERLAQGGMGEVFRAVAVGEHGFEKPVVVKRILPTHAGRDDLAELFIAEAKLMTRLSHPNIVEVLDFGRGDRGDYFLVLELVDGLDLGRLLQAFEATKDPFPIPLALFIATQALRGLHHAHSTEASGGECLVHRDVSPSNVLLSAEGEVKIADFGIAQVKTSTRRASSWVAGKVGYMAPEQLEGEVDPRADLFSVGVMLSRMVAGRLPFDGDTPEAQRAAIHQGARKRLCDLRSEVSVELEAIVEKALAEDPRDRFPDARTMAQALTSLTSVGHSIASPDDLSDVVREARAKLPKTTRPVIALSNVASDVPPDEPYTPKELSRGDGATFTLRSNKRSSPVAAHERSSSARPDPHVTIEVAPPRAAYALPVVPRESVPGPHSDAPQVAAARPREVPRAAVGILLVASGVIFAAFWRRPPPPTGAPAITATATAVVSSPSPSNSARESPVEPHSVSPVVFTQTPSNTASNHSPHTHAPDPFPTSRKDHGRTAKPGTEAPGGDECVGKVHISSNGSWMVMGGPATVQSPGWYSWPCGSYSLVARSREDPSRTKNASVTVHSDHNAEVDLR